MHDLLMALLHTLIKIQNRRLWKGGNAILPNVVSFQASCLCE